MDFELLLRYLLEFSMLLPAAVMALMPTAGHLRYRKSVVGGIAFACVVLLAVLGAYLSMVFELLSIALLIPCSAVLLALFYHMSTLEPAKKVHCVLNAAMLCAFSTMYACYVTAPWEVDNSSNVLTPGSAISCLLLAFLVGVLFSRTLIVKIPALFEYDSLNSMWKWVASVTLLLTALLVWLMPASAVNVMTGYVRPKSLAIMLLIPMAIWAIYHVAWLIAFRLSESERFKRENDLLKMEEKRHAELMSYIDDARAMRHDFRHHMAVVAELADSGKASEAAAYARRFVETTDATRACLYCANSSVDAIVAHFDAIATSNGVDAFWALDIPEKLPIDEVDFCSVLGNLVENALTAAAECDEDEKHLKVKASVFGENVVTLVVENGYKGVVDERSLRGAANEGGLRETLQAGSNDSLCSSRAGHGIGLTSVEAIVRKYEGNFSISTAGSTFTAMVVLYAR